jgi:methane/ammonia monooxygenase subunit B
VLVVKERWLNGVSTPGSVALRQSEEYEFKLVLRGRREGQYHAHPMVAVQGVGPLLGPGAWVQIRGGGPFENLLTLWNGKTINLETYALPRIAAWHAVVFVLGAAWLGYWIAQPMLRRSLGVARGAEGELMTRRDLRVSAVLGVLTTLVILVGILTTLAAYPHGIPHQVIKVDIPARPQPERIVGVNRGIAKYTPATRTLTLQVEVTNTGDEPLRLRQFVTSDVSFLNTAIVPKAEHLLVEETGDGVKPGETKVLTLTMADPVWHEKRLVDLRQPQLRFGGVLIFEGSQGARSLSPVNAQLRPHFKLAE